MQTRKASSIRLTNAYTRKKESCSAALRNFLFPVKHAFPATGVAGNRGADFVSTAISCNKRKDKAMSIPEKAAEIAGDVCGIVNKEFGNWCEKVTRKVLDFPCYPSIKFDNGRLKELKINCKFSTDVVNDTIEKVSNWLDEHVKTDNGQKITREMIEGIYKDKGLEIGTDRLVIRHVNPSTEPPARFRAVNDFSGATGHFGGFPNFHQADHGQGIVYGTILLNRNFVEWRDVPAKILGNPTDFGAHFRAVNDYATSQGFFAGFPNFHQADYGNGIVYGVMLLKSGAGEWRDISADELGNPSDIGDRFTAVNDYATSNGFRAAFPNFHQADHGNGIVYGTILLNDTAADWKDVPSAVLFPPDMKIDVVERKVSQPAPEPWEPRERPWDRL